MHVYHFADRLSIGTYRMMASDLLDTDPIQIGEWQAMDVSGSDLHKTHELEDVSLVWDQLPGDPDQVMPFIDTEWTDEHFAERIGGQPLNPAPSHERWPYAVGGNSRHMTGKKFDHTYPERFWPRYAGDKGPVPEIADSWPGHRGIHFSYGDLNDLVNLLVRRPLTRQAYLPVWFPEDTGAVDGQRVPCTLGYHFMQRRGFLSVRYYLRSCDIYRHLSNDAYFAARLTDWICDEVEGKTGGAIRFRPGSMHMHISSLHSFVADKAKMRERING